MEQLLYIRVGRWSSCCTSGRPDGALVVHQVGHMEQLLYIRETRCSSCCTSWWPAGTLDVHQGGQQEQSLYIREASRRFFASDFSKIALEKHELRQHCGMKGQIVILLTLHHANTEEEKGTEEKKKRCLNR